MSHDRRGRAGEPLRWGYRGCRLDGRGELISLITTYPFSKKSDKTGKRPTEPYVPARATARRPL